MRFRKVAIVGLVGAMLACLGAVPAKDLAGAQEQQRQEVQAETRAQQREVTGLQVAGQRAQPADTRLAAPDLEPLKYICMSGNCACAGVQDCVDMKDICAPGTMGCNEHGCTCAEGDSGDSEGDG